MEAMREKIEAEKKRVLAGIDAQIAEVTRRSLSQHCRSRVLRTFVCRSSLAPIASRALLFVVPCSGLFGRPFRIFC